MNKLHRFNESIKRAKVVREAAAAAVAELTSEIMPDEVTFTFAASGVDYNQLVLELRKIAAYNAKAVKEGEVIRVVSTNPIAVTKVLKYLGISADPSGTVTLDKEDKEIVA